MSAMHWSRPAAVRTLRALQQLGWKATTWGLAQATHSLAVHTDVAAARALLETELSFRDGNRALTCTHQRTTDDGRKVYAYCLQNWARPRVRRFLAGNPMQTALLPR